MWFESFSSFRFGAQPIRPALFHTNSDPARIAWMRRLPDVPMCKEICYPVWWSTTALYNIGKHFPFELYLVSFVLHLEMVLLMMFFLAMLDCQKVYPCWAAMLVVILFGSHVECDLLIQIWVPIRQKNHWTGMTAGIDKEWNPTTHNNPNHSQGVDSLSLGPGG